MRKSKGIGCEVKVMELGMRITRARARTLAMESAKTTRKNNKENKRKFDSRELEQCRSNCRRRRFVRRRRTRSETLRNSGEEDIPTTSRCSSNRSSELVNENLMKRSVIDLEDEKEEKNDKSTSSTSTCKRRRRKGEKEIEIEEITPSSSFRVEDSTANNLESMERPTPSISVSRNNDDERSEKVSPTEAEIDDFFSTPEKEEERRFANKYNYDIAKDVPLNGRYEWVRLKP